MSGRKVYTIKLAAPSTYGLLVAALKAWHVDPKSYTGDMKTHTITTRNQNVVDVCTEEILSERYTITSEPYRKQPPAPVAETGAGL